MSIKLPSFASATVFRLGAAFALSAGLVACTSTPPTPTTTASSLAKLTVKYSSSNQTAAVQVSKADGTLLDAFKLKSGAIIELPKGTYIVSLVNNAASAQVVDLTVDREVTFNFY